MTLWLSFLRDVLRRDRKADRLVPPAGHIARLTGFVAGVVAFLAVLALALALMAGDLGARWDAALKASATVLVLAPEDQMAAQTEAALLILRATPGVQEAHLMTAEQTQALLEPWFGSDLSVEGVELPQLIEVITGDGYDAQALEQRLADEVPGAVLDDHGRWQDPLVSVAAGVRLLAVLSLLALAGTAAAISFLAAHAVLAANVQVVQVLRMIGAFDLYIARIFVRRFIRWSFWGAVAGTVPGVIAVALLPEMPITGAGWGLVLFIPVVSAGVAFWATRAVALRVLERLS